MASVGELHTHALREVQSGGGFMSDLGTVVTIIKPALKGAVYRVGGIAKTRAVKTLKRAASNAAVSAAMAAAQGESVVKAVKRSARRTLARDARAVSWAVAREAARVAAIAAGV